MNIETKPDFWPVIQAADDCMIDLERTRDLLCLFMELLDCEVESLNEEKPWTITFVKNRHPKLRSLLDTINAQVYDVTISLSDAVDNGTKIFRENRQQLGNE